MTIDESDASRIAEAIRDELGWTAIEEPAKWCRTITREDGAGIYLHFQWNGERVEVTGRWPRGPAGSYAPRGTPKISFSITRSTHSMAADIKRRFLPEYIRLYLDALDSAQRDQADHDRAVKRIEELGMRRAKHENGSKLTGYFSAGRAETYRGETWHVTLDSVPDATMDELMAVISRKKPASLDGLEVAARIAETWCDEGHTQLQRDTAKTIAAAIRAAR
jgi:hypothetical protein